MKKLSEYTYKVEEAADLLGICPQALRVWLCNEGCPIGYSFVKPGCSNRNYIVSRAKVNEFLGIKEKGEPKDDSPTQNETKEV